MKNLFVLLLLPLIQPLFSEEHHFQKPEEVTYEWLKSAHDDTGGCAFVVPLKVVFDKIKVKSLLEFGLGYSTKYSLDVCKRVLSVEIITSGYGPNRLKHFVQFYKDYSNWVPIAYFSDYHWDMSWAPYKYIGSDAVHKAGTHHCVKLTHYKEIDPFYLKEMGDFLTNLSKYNKIEVALIHPIFYIGGDLVELLFNKVPIIIAQNTRDRAEGIEGPWGYKRVKTPDEYEEIYLPLKLSNGIVPGHTVWIAKKPEYQNIIEELRNIQ